mgnify:CR=1 FL=1
MQLELFDWKEEKRCTMCAKVKPLSCFAYKNASKKTYQVYCRSCKSEYSKKHYINNREALINQCREYFKNNPHIFVAKTNKRRAKKLNATPDWLTVEQIDEIKAKYKEAKELETLTGEKHHVDHIVPLNNVLVCGLHVPWNLQVIPASVNLRKSNSFNSECFT